MDTFISAKDTRGHLIQKYQFKVMSEKEHNEAMMQSQPMQQQNEQKEKTVQDPAAAQQSQQMQELSQLQQRVENNTVDNSQIETLLKKTDELSNSLLNMQKSYESQQEEFKKMVESAKEEAYKQGQLEAEKRLQEQLTQKSGEEAQKFIQSIERLDTITKKFQEKIDTVENDLIATAIDIAKEVIAKEVSKSSKDIALNLAYLLLDDIKDASKITLKVSPKDFTYIKQRMQTENVEVVSDDSVSEGGVLVLSEAGNIDGDLMQRFEKVKEMVFR